MPKYQNIGLDQSAFLSFVASPSDAQLATFVELLGSDEQANSWFAEEPPAWHNDPNSWVRDRLHETDWYAGMSEPEMVAWEHAMIYINDRCNFETAAPLAIMEHAAVDFDVFEFATSILERNGKETVCGRMFPYRFNGVSAEIEEIEPWARVFNINHAMLDVAQIEQLIIEFSDYENLLSDFTPGFESVFRSVEERKLNAINEARDLLGFLTSLVQTNSMWFAMIDS